MHPRDSAGDVVGGKLLPKHEGKHRTGNKITLTQPSIIVNSLPMHEHNNVDRGENILDSKSSIKMFETFINEAYLMN